MLFTEIVKGSGGHLSVLMTLSFRSVFEIIWRSRPVFKSKPLFLDTGFEKSRKFYVRNDIDIDIYLLIIDNNMI